LSQLCKPVGRYAVDSGNMHSSQMMSHWQRGLTRVSEAQPGPAAPPGSPCSAE